MSILVRLARAEDYASVEAVMRQVHSFHVELRPDIYRPVETVFPDEAFREAIETETVFVAEAEGRVVGVLTVLFRRVAAPHQVPRSIVFADTIAVDEGWRGRGVGRALIDRLRAIKAEKGLDGIELQVNARNENALGMYAHCGFTPKSINMELLE